MTKSDSPLKPLYVPPRYQALNDLVSSRVGQLQAKHLANARGVAGDFAALRRGVAAAPGSDPSIWRLTLEGLPDQYRGGDDRITAEEHAAHAALTLYATHQQSQPTGVHQRGITLGRATSRLSKEAGEAGVIRRFHALGTASSFTEVMHHARGLISQLRQKKIQLDYGHLAVDLARLQHPESAAAVRLAWGRDFTFPTRTNEQTESTDPTPNGDTE